MAKLSYIKQVIAEKTVCVLLVRGDGTEGNKLYAYVAVRADRLEEFLEAQAQGTFYPEDFGIVIESGEGEPSDEVKRKMTREYGFNHEGMVNIDNPAAAHDLASNISAFTKSASE